MNRLGRLGGRAAAGGKAFLSALYLTLAVFILVIAFIDLPGSVRAARNEGTPGMFTAVRKVCRPVWERGGGGCSYFGDFTSRDGSVRLKDVFYEGNPGGIGNSVAAQYVGTTDPPRVHKVDSDEWIFVTAFVVGSTGYLGLRAWRLVRWFRHRRSRSVLSRRSSATDA